MYLIIYQKVEAGDKVLGIKERASFLSNEKYTVKDAVPEPHWTHEECREPAWVEGVPSSRPDPDCKGCGDLVDSQAIAIDGIREPCYSRFFHLQTTFVSIKAIRKCLEAKPSVVG